MFRNNFWKRNISFFLCLILSLSLAACQEDPEGSIVVHKDLDNLISQAARPAESESGTSRVEAADIAEEVKQYESYQTTVDNESLNVTVNVDAQVQVPQVDSLNVYRVAQKPFTQEFVDKVRQALLGDEPLYDGHALYLRTKQNMEFELSQAKRVLNELEQKIAQWEAEGKTEEVLEDSYVQTLDSLRESLQYENDQLKTLQAQYDAAPEDLVLADYPCDGQMKPLAQRMNPRPDIPTVMDELEKQDADSQYLYAITDGSGGGYASLIVLNHATNSNVLRFRKNPESWERSQIDALSSAAGMYLTFQNIAAGQDPDHFSEEELREKLDLTDAMTENGLRALEQLPGNTARLSMEDALAQAEQLLGEIGLTDFRFAEGERVPETVNLIRPKGEFDFTDHWRSVYVLRYYREIEGVLMPQSSRGKWDAEQYVTKMWPGETIEIQINDTGIVGFDYFSPIEITETVVENAALKPFSEVKETFEKMLPIAMAKEEGTHMQADVEQVKLLYTRISERDSFDTGLIVPVWSFEGTWSVYANGEKIPGYYISLLNINAIDGSVINGELGY